MKLRCKFILLNLLCFFVFPAAADDGLNNYNQQQSADSLKKIVEYFQNLGDFLGFDIKTPDKEKKYYTINHSLINLPVAQLAQTYLFYTYLGAIPVNTFTNGASGGGNGENPTDPYAMLVPKENPAASVLNSQINNTFKNYNTVSSENVGVSNLIDQQTYQQDPVSQAVLNILSTPDDTYCMGYGGEGWDDKCTFLYDGLVSANVIGRIPTALEFFSPKYTQKFLNQLNSNALTGPLMYSTQSLNNNQTPANNDQPGLAAKNQAQVAANFIRYVSGAALPLQLPNWKDYDVLYLKTIAADNSGVTPAEKHKAQSILAAYLAGLRTYAAQSSVAIGNLYFIMSKRMPQSSQSDSKGTPMSQALSEFNMATWRLFNPTEENKGAGGSGAAPGSAQPGGTQWIDKINTSAPDTVQKEIALLLAEINYQMYLSRQIEERNLMTNSILMLQFLRTGAPSARVINNPR